MLIEKGRIADEHLVGEDTTRPPIYSFGMASLLDDFWCEVFGCATEGPGAILYYFGEAEVGNSEL